MCVKSDAGEFVGIFWVTKSWGWSKELRSLTVWAVQANQTAAVVGAGAQQDFNPSSSISKIFLYLRKWGWQTQYYDSLQFYRTLQKSPLKGVFLQTSSWLRWCASWGVNHTFQWRFAIALQNSCGGGFFHLHFTHHVVWWNTSSRRCFYSDPDVSMTLILAVIDNQRKLFVVRNVYQYKLFWRLVFEAEVVVFSICVHLPVTAVLCDTICSLALKRAKPAIISGRLFQLQGRMSVEIREIRELGTCWPGQRSWDSLGSFVLHRTTSESFSFKSTLLPSVQAQSCSLKLLH